MEESAKREEECGICLDALTNPVALPCSHKFCSECLDGWRSKYGASGDDEMNQKCPMCREKIPPSKEMINQLNSLRSMTSIMEALQRGDTKNALLPNLNWNNWSVKLEIGRKQ